MSDRLFAEQVGFQSNILGAPLTNTARAVANAYVCIPCQRKLDRRGLASAAIAVKEDTSTTNEDATHAHQAVSSSPRPVYRLQAGVVLSRPPQVTRDLHPFESSFFFYQRRLNERLALPFPRPFYFKKGTPAEIEWKRKQDHRLTPAHEIGRYSARRDEAWHDEVLVGAPESIPEHQVETILKEAEAPAISGGPEASAEIGGEQVANRRMDVERPMPRVTEADKLGDTKSLNRMLQRSLYLLVKNQEGKWRFPSSKIVDNEGLRRAAERITVEAGGPNMNTWVVGHAPVGHYARDFLQPTENFENKVVELGEKIFFMKSRIMAGQARLEGNKLGLTDFKWLTKDEIQKLATPRYWSMVEGMLTDR